MWFLMHMVSNCRPLLYPDKRGALLGHILPTMALPPLLSAEDQRKINT